MLQYIFVKIITFLLWFKIKISKVLIFSALYFMYKFTNFVNMKLIQYFSQFRLLLWHVYLCSFSVCILFCSIRIRNGLVVSILNYGSRDCILEVWWWCIFHNLQIGRLSRVVNKWVQRIFRWWKQTMGLRYRIDHCLHLLGLLKI